MKTRWVKWLALGFAVLAAPSDSRGATDLARQVQELIAGLDYDQARGELATADLEDPRVALERARLAVYELDCDGAAAILGRPELQKLELGEQLADIARGCQRVTAALAVDRDEERAIEVRWQDEHDRALAPLVFDTVVRARDALTRDLGVDWPRPTCIVVVRDLLSLSAMTGLPYKSAQTTGTVAVAKWGRITLLSPRASRHGYSWRDTLAHELTHLAVTRASRDRAPLWLQEGVAKYEEVRWRDPGPFDERPPAETIVRRGQEQKLAIPLDRLGPSIAMLPSADQATVAFAEVTSFVRFYVGTAGGEALPRLLAELKAGKEPDEALVAASGASLKEWDVNWRAYVLSQSRAPLPALLALGRGREVDGWFELRNRARLAELLLSRGHAAQALDELDHIFVRNASSVDNAADSVAGDPNLRWLRARSLEGAGRRQDGEGLVADPKDVLSSYAPWWALRGRWARLRGDEALATSSFIEAMAADPFDVEAACESTGDAGPTDPGKMPLCDVARSAEAPVFGED